MASNRSTCDEKENPAGHLTETDLISTRLAPAKALTSPVTLGAADTLKVVLTTQDGKAAKRPHQAFLLLQDPTTKLDVSYPFSVKESGKAKVELVGYICCRLQGEHSR